MDSMTRRERWLAALDMEPVDRLPFWPKLDGAYPRAQEPPFAGMELETIHDWIGSDRHRWIPTPVRVVRKSASVAVERDDGSRRTVFESRSGKAVRVDRFDEASQSWHPASLPVKTLRDIEVLTAFYEDEDWELDPDGLEKAKARKAEIGHAAATTNAIGESPLMHWVEWLAGVENAHLMLADHEREVEALFDAMHRSLLKETAILAEHTVADMIYLGENTSTTLISPAQYRKYCLRHITEYGEILKAAGKRLVLHMCGYLKDILPDLAKLPARAFEAFTSPPVGNTRLADGRAHCPGVCLIGGTNATLWTHAADEIIAELERDLDALPHHRGIIVTSAGVMPPLAKPEKIRTVCEWVKSYPAR